MLHKVTNYFAELLLCNFEDQEELLLYLYKGIKMSSHLENLGWCQDFSVIKK